MRQVDEECVDLSNAALKSPERLGRTERHGGLWKQMAKRVITNKRIVGLDQMRWLASESNDIKNNRADTVDSPRRNKVSEEARSGI